MRNRTLLLFTLISAQLMPFVVSPTIVFSDDQPIRLDIDNPQLKIVQFTDLHLTYGFDANDKKTFKLITDITTEVKPDLIVFTGDQTLSLTAPALYRDLIRHMEQFETPWTFIFGNHEDDFHSYKKMINVINNEPSEYLYFKLGPNLERGGYGNFAINYYYNNNPFYNLYFLDSKAELKQKRTAEDLTRYDYFSPAQVNWFSSKVQTDKTNNIKSAVFTHIPLVQYALANKAENAHLVTGDIGEHIYHQARDTGFYDAMKNAGMSEGIFVGHDHRNNFVFDYEGIKLVYGQNSGYNGYGNIKRGARIIEIDPTGLDTYVIYGDSTYEK